MGFSILPRNRLCSIISSWFRLRFRGLSPYSFGILFHHHFLVPARVPGLVAQTSLELNGVLNSFKKQFFSTRLFSGILAFCSIIISSVLLVSGRFPGIVSLVFWHSVPSSSSCPGSIWFQEGFRGLSPCVVALCSIMISSFLLVPARVPGFVSLLFLSFLSQEEDCVPS